MSQSIDSKKLFDFVEDQFDKTVIKTLSSYIEIPNQSPLFDEKIHENGLQEKAIQVLIDWVKEQNVPTLKHEVFQEKEKTPLILLEIPATKPEAGTILMYGHMDKQPPMTGWNEDLGPYKPVVKDNNGEPWLYGRAGADDGYSICSAVLSIRALQLQNIPHGRIVILIEGSEESGSPDLPFYIDLLKNRIGNPNLVICLDSGAGDYKRLWITTSLRGIIILELHVEVLREGVHSGIGSGSYADSFRIARSILSRLEDEKTGEIIPKELHCEIPHQRAEQIKEAAEVLGTSLATSFPALPGVKPVSEDMSQLLSNRTWKPTLTVTGVGDIPSMKSAGNVLRPKTSLKLSIRLPPKVSPKEAEEFLIQYLEKDPPYGAKVTVKSCGGGPGWEAPAVSEWLQKSAANASSTYYNGNETCYIGEGGSIPFMGMLGKKFPQAQFLIIGILGPQSNAHGPNEGMNIPFCKKLTACVSHVVADHAIRPSQ